MNPQNIDFEKIKLHWIDSSDENYITMQHLFESKDYDWALFLGHLVIEKLLKAYFVYKNNEFPPMIHNLLRLAELSHIELNDKNIKLLSTVTSFNINARYDDYKESFSKLCTKEFTEYWINKIKDLRLWIKSLLSI